MPTYNRVDRLRRALAAFGRQSVDSADFEVVVVSDGSTDGTDRLVSDAKMPFRLVFCSQDNAGPAAARNHGARVAEGDLVLYVDDDVVAEPDLIEQHLRSHQSYAGHEKPVVVVGPMLTPPDYRPNVFVRWEQAMLYKQYEALRRGEYTATHRQFYTGNASLNRRLLLDVGGFDERFRRAEDVELAYRLAERGTQFVFNEHAVGYHYAERSFDSWIRIARDYGKNEVVFDREQYRGDGLKRVGREFDSRHLLIKWMTRACVGRPRAESSVRSMSRAVVAASDRLGLDGVAQLALSGLYNTTYYSGMANELGGAQAFWELVGGRYAPSGHSGP
jgi:GT2 family glycosyltransferase